MRIEYISVDQDIMEILNRYGHDVPGLVSGELTGELDPYTQGRISSVIMNMAISIRDAERHIALGGGNG